MCSLLEHVTFDSGSASSWDGMMAFMPRTFLFDLRLTTDEPFLELTTDVANDEPFLELTTDVANDEPLLELTTDDADGPLLSLE